MTAPVTNEYMLTLACGRTLGLSESGDPKGIPVLAFHGLPGSRFQRHPDERIPLELGARVLHLERPGFGLSDPAPGRTLLDWAADVGEVCDLLDLRSVRIVGVSGGGPYALACAAALGQRIVRTAIVSGVGIPGTVPPEEITPFIRLGFTLAQWAPWSLHLFTSFASALSRYLPEKYSQVLTFGLNATDKRVCARSEVRRMFMQDMYGAFAQSGRAFAEDLTIIAAPWGFDPATIQTPLALWHGADDLTVPITAARTIAARVPGAELYELVGDGHFFILERWREILAWVVR